MALTSKNQTLIAYKKLVGKTHTDARITAAGEKYGSNVQLDSEVIFASTIPVSPNLTGVTNNIVEKVVFTLESIPDSIYGANTGTGEGETATISSHAFLLKLPSTYVASSNNPKKGTSVFLNGAILAESNGKLQVIPEKYGDLNDNRYKPVVKDSAGNVLYPLDNEDWYLDTYAGILFIQDPIRTPNTVEAYLYIGEYLSDTAGASAAGSTGYLQYNNNGVFDASSNLFWDIANNRLGIGTTNASDGKLTISAGTNPQPAPVTALAILGPNSPGNENSSQDIRWNFSAAGGSFIRSYRGSTWNTYLAFGTTPASAGSNSPTTKMTIDGDGNVGIGITSPQSRLHVSGSSGLTVNTVGNVWAVFGADVTNSNYMAFRRPNSVASLGFLGSGGGGALTAGTSSDLVIRSEVSLYLATGGNNARMTIDSVGNVGIGTTSPGTKLEVAGAIRGGSFNVGTTNTSEAWFGRGGDRTLGTFTLQLGGSSATNTGFEIVDRAWSKRMLFVSGEAPEASLIVDSAGNVGIGTPIPGEKLEVRGNIRLGGPDAGPNYIAFRGTTGDNPGLYDHGFIGERIYSGTEFSELFIFKGNDNANGAGPDRIRLGAGQIELATYNTPVNGDFTSVATNGNVITRLTIDPAGNVGIGTTSPTQGKLVISAPDNDTASAISIRQSNSLSYGFDFALDQVVNGNGFLYGIEGVDKREIMQWTRNPSPNLYLLNGGGNVGINRTDPSYKLDVNGQVRATSGFVGDLTGNAATAGTATNTINPTFSGDSVAVANITNRVDSGFYEYSLATTALGWPVNSGTWQHLLSTTHSNDTNYFAMQLAAPFYSQEWYLRNTNGSGTTGWKRVVVADSNTYNINAATATTLPVLGAYSTPQEPTGTRTSLSTGVYSYNVYFSSLGDGTPTQYWSLLNFGNGTSGQAQLAASWTDGGTELYFRSLRDTSDNWWTWKEILHSSNYNSYSPTLTGTGASGTWGINISGNAATATLASGATSATVALNVRTQSTSGVATYYVTFADLASSSTLLRNNTNFYINPGNRHIHALHSLVIGPGTSPPTPSTGETLMLNTNQTNNLNYIRYATNGVDTGYIGYGSTTNNNFYVANNLTSTGGDTTRIVFRANNVEAGYIDGSGGNAQLNFTGQHRNISDDLEIYHSSSVGKIVVSCGQYSSIDSNSITINEALPKIEFSTKRKQKSVFGVVSDKEDENSSTREYRQGSYVTVVEKPINDNRLIINSLGEGGVWVCNINGNLENGDYITTCEIPGYGMKQDDDLLHNYTVAKITCDCDFDLNSPIYICEEIEWEGVTYRRAFVGCTYHCG